MNRITKGGFKKCDKAKNHEFDAENKKQGFRITIRVRGSKSMATSIILELQSKLFPFLVMPSRFQCQLQTRVLLFFFLWFLIS